MGGLGDFGRVGGGGAFRPYPAHSISKGRYHGGPMVKIILKILVKFPMVK